MAEPVWVVGDPQGWFEPLLRILREVGLIDRSARWIGGGATLVVAGDLVDRGPDSIGVIDLLMRLQAESGGQVRVVIGNHDLLLLAAHRFRESMLHKEWLDSGGAAMDLERLSNAQVEWLSSLPAMVRIQDSVILHADGMFYREYGSTLDEVNSTFSRVLHGDDLAKWKHLLGCFEEHRAFTGGDGESHLTEVLGTFRAAKLVHGHTPIARMLGVPPESVTEAYVYQGGRCVNVDPGIYLGGPGFAYRLP